ncbi:probable E3 ubiquitin-protein ligase ATL45 [Typha latifolia]|uniref:probable E3 ubiquitin-protein ligase ATL45 n=1 Tax=Typha latifolia TaxID=4733 RepID=UPI003C2C3342
MGDQFGPPSPTSSNHFALVAIVVGVVVGLAALVGAPVILVYCLRRWRSDGIGASGGSVPETPPPPEGLEMAVVEALPMASYPPEQADGSNLDPTCPICLEDVTEGENVIVLPCQHFFHPHCISDALQQRPRCPNCNLVVV